MTITLDRVWQAILQASVADLRRGLLAVPGDPLRLTIDAVGQVSPGTELDVATRELLRLYVPLRTRPRLCIAQIGQSLDGRIAAENGHSHFVTGDDDIRHLHRLRALVDAVLVGPGTVLADDPRLTVRRVHGANPVRVVLDPRGTLPADRRVFHDRQSDTVLCHGGSPRKDLPAHVRQLALPASDGTFDPAQLVAALDECGLRHLLVEGGGRTVSQFLAAGQLTDLSVTVAPMLIGPGIPAFTLPPISDLGQALRPPCRQFSLGEDRLFLFDLSQSTAAPGRLPNSTSRP